jgi:hypothetical protein
MDELATLLTGESFVDTDGRVFRIPPELEMWNAGVVGMHPKDEGLLELVLRLTDQLCARSTLHVLEQLAFSYVLQTHSRLHEACDVVFHFWPPYLRSPFKKKLPGIFERTEGMSWERRIDFCYRNRPRPTVLRRGKVILKRCLQWAGMLKGRARSNEW